MKNLTILSTGVALATVLVLNGCSGSSTTDTTLSGTAIDPELSGATVCLDLDKNRVCDANEPTTKTDVAGQYRLTITSEQHAQTHALLAHGGVDTGTGKAFSGKLTAVKNAGQTVHNISPLTAMVEARYEYCLTSTTCQETAETIRMELAEHVELHEAEIDENIVTLANEGNREPLKVALACQKSAEILDPEDSLKFYRLMAEKGFAESATWKEHLDEVVAASPYADETHALVSEVMDITTGTAHEIAQQVQDTILPSIFPTEIPSLPLQ